MQFSCFVHPNEGWGDFGVVIGPNDFRPVIPKDGNAAIGRAEINSKVHSRSGHKFAPSVAFKYGCESIRRLAYYNIGNLNWLSLVENRRLQGLNHGFASELR